MNKNAAMVLGLMTLLIGLVGWLLLGPQAQSGEVLGQDHTEINPTPDRGDAELGASTGGDREQAGRVEVELPEVPKIDTSRERPDVDATAVTGRVVALDGRPITGAEVEVWTSIGGLEPYELGITSDALERPGLEHPKVTYHAQVRTDPAGQFELDALPGLHYVNIEVRSLPLATLRVFSIEPRPGRARDLGEFVMVPPGSIAGTVATRDGLPLRGAEIYLASESVTSGRVTQPAQVVGLSDGLGRFAIQNLEPGHYALAAVANGYALGFSSTVRLTHETMNEVDVEIQLDEGFPVMGKVVDSTSGAPIAGATVTMRPNNGNNVLPLEVVTDALGLFTHPGLVESNYLRLNIDSDGYLSLTAFLQAKLENAAAVNATFQMFVDRTLTVKVIDDATEAPIVGARIDARTGSPNVMSDAIQMGFAALAGTEPLAWTDAEGSALLSMDRDEPWLTVHADGYAPVTERRAPRASGGRSGPGKVEDSELTVRLRRGATLALRVTGKQAAVAGVEVELRVADNNPDADEQSNDRPQNNWRRNNNRGNQFSTSALGWRSEAGLTPVLRTSTDAQGEAQLNGLPTGLYFVELRAPLASGFGTQMAGPFAIRSETERSEVEIEMQAAGRVDGFVMFRGELAAGQRVLLIAPADGSAVQEGRELPSRAQVFEATADEDGAFEIPGVPPGTWKAVALLAYSVSEHNTPTDSRSALDHQLAQNAQLIQVAAGSTTTITLEGQSRGARLTGYARANHEPVRNARITGNWRSPDGDNQSFSTRTDANGFFEAKGLLPGEWTLSATMRSTTKDDTRQVNTRWIPFYTGTVFVPDGGEATANIDNELGAVEIKITVKEPKEKPKDEAGNELELADIYWTRVRLTPDMSAGGAANLTENQVVDAWVQHNRLQLIENLPAGTYKITVDSNAFDRVKATVKILPGTEAKTQLEPVLKGKDANADYWFID